MNRAFTQCDTQACAPHAELLADLTRQCETSLSGGSGKAQTFKALLQGLPDIRPSEMDLNAGTVRIGTGHDLSKSEKIKVDAVLKGLHPWRKGPFDIFGTRIDCEWRSDLKWNRVKDRIAPLRNRKILDIGSSNGYYLFRMSDAAPRLAIGLEPYLTFYFQFQALQAFIRAPQIHCLPVRFDDFPVLEGFFDTVFCMGVLYHSRSPLDLLVRIRQQLDKAGELVLETLIIEGGDDTALCPFPRYAKMNNAYFLPTVPCLKNWLQRAGFTDIRCVDITRTTSEEQRKTDWMTFESLTDFLDPKDPTLTVEGYPAPTRAILLARSK